MSDTTPTPVIGARIFDDAVARKIKVVPVGTITFPDVGVMKNAWVQYRCVNRHCGGIADRKIIHGTWEPYRRFLARDEVKVTIKNGRITHYAIYLEHHAWFFDFIAYKGTYYDNVFGRYHSVDRVVSRYHDPALCDISNRTNISNFATGEFSVLVQDRIGQILYCWTRIDDSFYIDKKLWKIMVKDTREKKELFEKACLERKQ